jgi:polysaccharide export outer membrane protein
VSVVLWAFVPAQAQEPPETQEEYLVGVGDVIEVTIFQQEEISGEFPVEASGAIIFPLLGEVEVSGMPTSQIAKLLETLLEKDYYVDVQVKIEVKEYGSQPVTLLGEVQNPGTFYLEGKTNLTELLAMAGGIAPTAGPTLELRRDSTSEGASTPSVSTFSIAKVLTGEEGRDVVLVAGDVVSVSAKQIYFITGEVVRPGQYEITTGMTLMQAISQAGGVGKFASQIVELHRDVNGQKNILNYDLSRIRKGREIDPPVLSDDTIIVKRRFF